MLMDVSCWSGFPMNVEFLRKVDHVQEKKMYRALEEFTLLLVGDILSVYKKIEIHWSMKLVAIVT